LEYKSAKGSLKRKELTSVCRKELFHRFRYITYFSVILLLLIAIASMYFYISKNSLAIFQAWWPFSLVIISWWLYAFWYFPISGKFYKFAKTSLAPAIHGISEEKYTFESEDGTTLSVPLSNFYKINIIGDFVTLRENPNSLHVMPLELYSNENKAKVCAIIESVLKNA